MADRRLTLGLLAAIPTILIWGVTFVNTKALLADFSPFEILFIRFAVAYAALWAWRPRAMRTGGWREEWKYAAMGLSGIVAYQFLENCAIGWTTASNVSILVSICPMTTGLFSSWILGERLPGWRFWAGFALAMGGVCMVSLNGAEEVGFNPLGDAMALTAAISWSLYSVLITKMNARGEDAALMTRRTFFWALAFMLPMLGFGLTGEGKEFAGGIMAVEAGAAENAARFGDWLNWLNLGFLGVLASALCFATWSLACGLLGTVRATVGIYTLPAVTVVMAWAFLGERLTLAGAAGALITVGGVVLAQRRG